MCGELCGEGHSEGCGGSLRGVVGCEGHGGSVRCVMRDVVVPLAVW